MLRSQWREEATSYLTQVQRKFYCDLYLYMRRVEGVSSVSWDPSVPHTPQLSER